MGPVTHYGFNEGTGNQTLDLSGNGHTGSRVGATFQNPKKEGTGSIRFDGVNDYVQAPTAGMSRKQGTIALWLRPEGWSGSDYQAYGVYQTNSGVNSLNWLSLFKWYGNIFYFRLGSSSGCCSNDLTFAPSVHFDNNTWTHLAATWNEEDNSMRVYIDGVQIASRTNINWNGPDFVANGRFGLGHDVVEGVDG